MPKCVIAKALKAIGDIHEDADFGAWDVRFRRRGVQYRTLGDEGDMSDSRVRLVQCVSEASSCRKAN
jgi:hypothetical protein